MGFTKAELESYRDATLPDLIGPSTRLLFVGINPGLWTAAAQAHFARRGNRFYPALHLAGIIDRPIDASAGYDPRTARTCSTAASASPISSPRATARADELTAAELLAGGRRLEAHVAELGVKVVAVLGITAYRTAYARPKAVAGRQPENARRRAAVGRTESQRAERALLARRSRRRLPRGGRGRGAGLTASAAGLG